MAILLPRTSLGYEPGAIDSLHPAAKWALGADR